MTLRGRRMAFAAASPSLPIPAGKESVVETDGYQATAASPPLGGSAVTAAPEEEMETDAGAGRCSWKASGVQPVAPSATATTGLVAVEGS